ncbi:MAG: peptidoglycan editing factor PgeF [Pseudohongiellaceae bacterium]
MKVNAVIKANWSAPTNVTACVVTRRADVDDVLQQKQVQWLQQVHGKDVLKLEAGVNISEPKADAIYTQVPGIVCGIHTADCLPVFFSDQKGREIALAHAGWRGLAMGVLENTLACFKAKHESISVWFGPAIGPCHFEVGEEVRDIYLQQASQATKKITSAAFVPGAKNSKWMADLYKLAQIRLNDAGLFDISGGGLCTFCDPENFYSYRRDKETGRLSSLIWLK